MLSTEGSMNKTNISQKLFCNINKTLYFYLMRLKYDGEKLAKEVRIKRLITLNVDLRDAAKEIGIGYATLSRIENKKKPDIETLAAVCYWIGQPIDNFFKKGK